MSMIAVGAYIRVLRDHRGFTQADMESLWGISERKIARWEKGENEPAFTDLAQAIIAVDGRIADAVELLLSDDATAEDGKQRAAAWLRLPEEERHRLQREIASMSPSERDEELEAIVELIADARRRDRTFITWLRGAVAAWFGRG